MQGDTSTKAAMPLGPLDSNETPLLKQKRSANTKPGYRGYKSLPQSPAQSIVLFSSGKGGEWRKDMINYSNVSVNNL